MWLSKPKYNTNPTKLVYGSKQQVFKLVEVQPPETTDSNAAKFMKSIWKVEAVTVNFQEQIDNQKVNLVTPEAVEKNGLQLDTKNVSYQTVPLTTLNSTDVHNLSKDMVNAFVYNQATKTANQQIKEMVKQQDLDAEITKARTRLDMLTKQKENGGK